MSGSNSGYLYYQDDGFRQIQKSAKAMMSMRGGRGGGRGPGGPSGAPGGAGGPPGGGGGPTITDAKGSAKFWTKDGVLTKYEIKVSGKMDFNGQEMNQDRTTTVEITDIGTTKVEVPEAAKKLLEAAN